MLSYIMAQNFKKLCVCAHAYTHIIFPKGSVYEMNNLCSGNFKIIASQSNTSKNNNRQCFMTFKNDCFSIRLIITSKSARFRCFS